MSAFRVVSVAAAAISVAVTPLSAALAEDEAVVLEPTRNWQLDYGENRCRIARTFGDDKNETLFYLEQWEPAIWAAALVAGPSVEKYRSGRATRFTFGTGGEEDEFELRDMTLGDFGDAIAFRTTIVPNGKMSVQVENDAELILGRGRFTKLASQAATGINRVTLSQKGSPTVTLNIGSMEEPLEAMNACMKDLVAHWGFDVAEQETIVEDPKPGGLLPVARRIQSNYPASALRKGAQADFQMRLTIEADGSITDCQLVNLTLADDFDMKRHPCKAFQELAEFEPARTAFGEAVRSYSIQRIRYMIPD